MWIAVNVGSTHCGEKNIALAQYKEHKVNIAKTNIPDKFVHLKMDPYFMKTWG